MGAEQSSSYHFLYNLASVNTLSADSVMPKVRQMDQVSIVLPAADKPWVITETKNCVAEVAAHPTFASDTIVKVTRMEKVGDNATVRLANDDAKVPSELRQASFSLFVQAATNYHHLYNLSSLVGSGSNLITIRKIDKVTIVLPKTSHPWSLADPENCDAVLADHMFEGQKTVVMTNFKEAKKDAWVKLSNPDPTLPADQRNPFFKLFVQA